MVIILIIIIIIGGLGTHTQDVLEPWLSGFMQPSIYPWYS